MDLSVDGGLLQVERLGDLTKGACLTIAQQPQQSPLGVPELVAGLDGPGAKFTLAIGAVVLSGGYLVAMGLMDAPWQLMLATLVASSGVGIGYAAMPTLILDNVPEHESGSSVGLNGLMRSVGTTIAGAVMAAILTSRTITLGGHVIPDESAVRICFVVGAGAALAGALVCLLIPRQRTAVDEAAPEEVAAPV
ncbi:MAG: MFS transporter [Janibacter sp.]